MYSEDFYCWGLVMVGQVADLVYAEMVVRVEDFGFVAGFVVDPRAINTLLTAASGTGCLTRPSACFQSPLAPRAFLTLSS